VLWGALLLIASGTAALIYQVLWIKQLTLIVGVDVYAVTTGVSAFFAGLALGGLVLGRFVDRVQRPLRVYATLEMGVALVGVLVTMALSHTAALFVALEEQSGVLAWGFIFFMVGVGPFLMGGTLPAMVRSLRLTADRIGSGGGLMYGANTAGAIIGALVSSFLLIPALGILGSALTAAGIGILAATGGFWLDRFAPNQTSVAQQSNSTPCRCRWFGAWV
jgi:MFS family permease